jgi:hypothetical protein
MDIQGAQGAQGAQGTQGAQFSRYGREIIPVVQKNQIAANELAARKAELERKKKFQSLTPDEDDELNSINSITSGIQQMNINRGGRRRRRTNKRRRTLRRRMTKRRRR